MKNEEWIKDDLTEIANNHLERKTRTYHYAKNKICDKTSSYLNFSSNNYLGLANHPKLISYAQKYCQDYGAGATASRLIIGTMQCHDELEYRLAEFKGYPASLVFGSGFLTNIGVITSLVNKNDHIFADRLVHASLIDAIILSKAKIYRFNHNDPEHLAGLLKKCPNSGKRLIVTESIFSMDGDCAPLQQITTMAEKFRAMVMVDEAHTTGIFGPLGRGMIAEQGLEERINVAMGTFSKGLGSYGGFITGSMNIKKLLINKARSFIYTTALPPAIIGAIIAALELLQSQPLMGKKLLERAQFMRNQLSNAGLNTGNSESQIIPIIIGETSKTLGLAQRLRQHGILAVPIRYPTVPKNTARIRLSVTLDHTMEILQQASSTIINCARLEGIL